MKVKVINRPYSSRPQVIFNMEDAYEFFVACLLSACQRARLREVLWLQRYEAGPPLAFDEEQY